MRNYGTKRVYKSRRYGRKRRGTKLKPLLYAKRKVLKNLVRIGETVEKKQIVLKINQIGFGTGGTGFCFFGNDPGLVTTAKVQPEVGSIGGYENGRLSSSVFVSAFELNVNITAGDPVNRVRVIICRSLGGFLGSDLSNYMLSLPNPSFDYINEPVNTGNVFVYYDQTFTISQTTQEYRPLELKVIKKCPLEIEYSKMMSNSPSTAPGKVSTPFYLVMISDSGVAPFPVATGYMRFWYTGL